MSTFILFNLVVVLSLFPLSKLDPPDSHCLFLKGATVAFLNDEVWNLSNVQQGKYLYILFPTDLNCWLGLYT